MIPSPSQSLQLAFFALAPGDSEPTLLTVHRSDALRSDIQEGVLGAMDDGGVWDWSNHCFHPWHAISRAEWITKNAEPEPQQILPPKLLIDPFADYQAREEDSSFWDTLDRLVNVSSNSKLARSRHPSPATRLRNRAQRGEE